MQLILAGFPFLRILESLHWCSQRTEIRYRQRSMSLLLLFQKSSYYSSQWLTGWFGASRDLHFSLSSLSTCFKLNFITFFFFCVSNVAPPHSLWACTPQNASTCVCVCVCVWHITVTDISGCRATFCGDGELYLSEGTRKMNKIKSVVYFS